MLTVLLIACTTVPALARTAILCTTFPMYQITRNVAETDNNLDIELLLSSQMGCPHGYTLSPQDMKKIAKADILVVNGLGMEEFLDGSIQEINPDIQIIDSSKGIKTMAYKHRNHHAKKHDQAHTHHEHGDNHDRHRHTCNHNHDSGPNPHLFASPLMTTQIAMNIAAGLSRVNPSKATIYFQQATKYEKAMNALADEMAAIGKRLKNKRIIQPHGAFDYLARDMGIHIIDTMQPHGQKPSAAEMVHLVRRINQRKVGAIFTEPQYPQNTGKTLSKETGVPVVIIDPVATGPDKAPLDYYETTMRHNLKLIEQTLGTK